MYLIVITGKLEKTTEPRVKDQDTRERGKVIKINSYSPLSFSFPLPALKPFIINMSTPPFSDAILMVEKRG